MSPLPGHPPPGHLGGPPLAATSLRRVGWALTVVLRMRLWVCLWLCCLLSLYGRLDGSLWLGLGCGLKLRLRLRLLSAVHSWLSCCCRTDGGNEAGQRLQRQDELTEPRRPLIAPHRQPSHREGVPKTSKRVQWEAASPHKAKAIFCLRAYSRIFTSVSRWRGSARDAADRRPMDDRWTGPSL